MKAIIFGINGQDGFYLDQLLKKQAIEVVGVGRTPGTGLTAGDIKDHFFVEQLIKSYQPDYIFHFAANSTASHTALFENHETISTGTLNVLESVYQHSRHSRVFLSGSALQFENKGLPIDENTPFAATSHYAVARIQSVYAGRYYRSLGLLVYAGYFFHHDSPLRTERHINQKIALAVKRIALGHNEKIGIGDITVQKEFNYAGDVVNAVWKLINQQKVFESVIGSGIAYSIADWLEHCFSLINRNWKDFVELKEGFQAEYKILVSNPALIKSIGWMPEFGIDKLSKIMVGL